MLKRFRYLGFFVFVFLEQATAYNLVPQWNSQPFKPDELTMMQRSWAELRPTYLQQLKRLTDLRNAYTRKLEDIAEELDSKGRVHAANFYRAAETAVIDRIAARDLANTARFIGDEGAPIQWFESVAKRMPVWQSMLAETDSASRKANEVKVREEWSGSPHWRDEKNALEWLMFGNGPQNHYLSPEDLLSEITTFAFPLFSPARLLAPSQFNPPFLQGGQVEFELTEKQKTNWRIFSFRDTLLPFLYVSANSLGDVGRPMVEFSANDVRTRGLGHHIFIPEVSLFRDVDLIAFILDGGPDGSALRVKFVDASWDSKSNALQPTYDHRNHRLHVPAIWNRAAAIGDLPRLKKLFSFLRSSWEVNTAAAPESCWSAIRTAATRKGFLRTINRAE